MKKLMITVVIIAVLLMPMISTMTAKPIGYESYTVQPGDSLWTIAANSNGYGTHSTRKIVDDIMAESDCTALIQPGQQIQIPVYRKGLLNNGNNQD